MEFVAQREVLLRALQRTLGITEKKSTMPMVSAVLIEAMAPSTLRLSATDLEVALTGEYTADVAAPGRVAVAARQAADIVRSLATEKVTVRLVENNWVHLTAGRAEFKLVGLAAEEFPTLPSIEGATLAPISADTFRVLVERTLFSVSTDETRYNLMGVYVEPARDGILRFVSSDGHRLSIAERRLEGEEKVTLPTEAIIPKKGLAEARRLLEGEGGYCELGLAGNTFAFRHGDVLLMMRPIEGKFPDYRMVLPAKPQRVATLQRSALTDALKRVSLLALDKANTTRLHFSAGKLELAAVTPQLGEAREEIEADLEGQELRVGFNARYLLDALGAVPTDRVRIELGDDQSPGLVKPVDAEGFMGVIMPIRI
jgi:DNA polymerase-3 subunit beta